MTKILATDFALKRFPIRVNSIAPGVFPSKLTAMGDELVEFSKGPAVFQTPIPLRRAGRWVLIFNTAKLDRMSCLPYSPHEMAAIAVYLASPASTYTNGQEIIVDGGVTLVNP